MTTNQAIALAFPFLTVAAAGLMALLLVKPWRKKRIGGARRVAEGGASFSTGGKDPTKAYNDAYVNLSRDLEEADKLIQRAQRQLAKAQ